MQNHTFQYALLPTGLARDVAVEIDSSGTITRVTPDSGKGDSGFALPGIANLHSHAHQRAMAGLAERSGDSTDSFWTWRETMYRFIDAMTPDQLGSVARQLYVEMLKAGYTRVAEFQYLHHQPNGIAYAQRAEMSLQTLAAAVDVGIGITNLPVHYQYGGFDRQPVGQQQKRFYNTPSEFVEIVNSLHQKSSDYPNVNTGIAAHSLRAVDAAVFSEVQHSLSQETPTPVHIHIAEQQKEVDDCMAWCGQRPVEHLFEHFNVDSNWCLVHATHMTQQETTSLASSGAVAGLCPTTEANLGDGFFNASQYFDEAGSVGIGSDSHISVSLVEELRWLEYGQRLLTQSRNHLAGGRNRSTGRNLYEHCAAGGAKACGHNGGVLKPGTRADFIVLDTDHPLLCERDDDSLIDSFIFSGNQNLVRDVYVGGVKVLDNGQHPKEQEIAEQFKSTMNTLRSSS